MFETTRGRSATTENNLVDSPNDASTRNSLHSQGISSVSRFEDYFEAAICALEDKGLDFPGHARRTLVESLGQASAETMFVILGSNAFDDPRSFAEQVCGFLGVGSRAICKLIVSKGSQAVEGGRLLRAVDEFESNSTLLAVGTEAEKRKKPVLLHDHRVPDELEEYMEVVSEQTDRPSTISATFW